LAKAIMMLSPAHAGDFVFGLTPGILFLGSHRGFCFWARAGDFVFGLAPGILLAYASRDDTTKGLLLQRNLG
jgi:hypothetical protein